MKICGIICEYNPFHNGHLYHLEQAKRLSKADYVVCIMSGNYVQRGEAAILEKHVRAKHAFLAGADAVLELPTLFATSSAEIFAKGAIKLLLSVPNVTHICFGAETAERESFYACAKLLNNEPAQVSEKIKDLIASGTSYAKARVQAFSPYGVSDLLTKPNNLLGVEYTRALISAKSNVEILPIERRGGSYSDENLLENLSSATAIRKAISENDRQNIQTNVPPFVWEDLILARNTDLSAIEKYAILSTEKSRLAETLDCTEGLENAFILVAKSNVKDFEKKLTSARYTTSRIKRIALQNLLKIRKTDVVSALKSDLYLRILAIKKENDTLLSALGKSAYPLLVKNGDYKKLTNTAKTVFETESFADSVYAIASNTKPFYNSPLY